MGFTEAGTKEEERKEPIRLHLSKDVPNNEHNTFRSKFLRIASITEMEAHRGVDFFESHDCSDHSIGTNQERYLDQNILSLTLTGAYALNVWVDATPNKLYPRFHCLVPHVKKKYHFLINELDIVSVPQFDQGGSLYPVPLSATDNLVVYHCSVGTHI